MTKPVTFCDVTGDTDSLLKLELRGVAYRSHVDAAGDVDDGPVPERRVLDLSHAGAMKLIRVLWVELGGNRDLRVLDNCLARARREG